MKLFGAGKLPPELAAAAEQGPLLVAEQIKLRAGGEMRTPGRMTSGFSAMHGGGVVILPGRVLASFARYVIIDDQLGAAAPAEPATRCSIAADGVRVAIDIARVIPGGTGQVDIEWRVPIGPDVLAALPTHEWQGTLATADPQLMLRRI